MLYIKKYWYNLLLWVYLVYVIIASIFTFYIYSSLISILQIILTIILCALLISNSKHWKIGLIIWSLVICFAKTFYVLTMMFFLLINEHQRVNFGDTLEALVHIFVTVTLIVFAYRYEMKVPTSNPILRLNHSFPAKTNANCEIGIRRLLY